MEKLTAEIIKEQLIGETNGHMASIPNNPFMFTMFQVYVNTHYAGVPYNKDIVFAEFLEEISSALSEKDTY